MENMYKVEEINGQKLVALEDVLKIKAEAFENGYNEAVDEKDDSEALANIVFETSRATDKAFEKGFNLGKSFSNNGEFDAGYAKGLKAGITAAAFIGIFIFAINKLTKEDTNKKEAKKNEQN